eukprot:scaffold51698_cov48-Phaeocystis_antarctica.AAC.2
MRWSKRACLEDTRTAGVFTSERAGMTISLNRRSRIRCAVKLATGHFEASSASQPLGYWCVCEIEVG